MGIFQSRPEEPDEWAGLPSEPWEPRLPGELLPPAYDTLGGGATTIEISFEQQVELVGLEVDVADADADADANADD